MGLRWMVGVLLIHLLLWSETTSYRIRRQVSVSNHHPEQPKSSESRSYQPPILPGAPSVPVASSATIQNSYQPPISLIRSNEYHSPISNHPSQYSGGQAQGHIAQGSSRHQQSALQTYILPNQPAPPSYSINQQASPNTQHSYSVYQQPSNSQNSQPIPPATSHATSYSVHQQPAAIQNNPKQSYPIFSDASGLPQATVERTYSSHAKAVDSSHVPAQAIHKAPASEIQSDKGSLAKDKDNMKDEYVVYYYYYYDNDTAPNNNLSLNFDDIPSLEAYDEKNGKEPERSASARTLAANINSLGSVTSDPKKDNTPTNKSNTSQPRSVANNNRESVIRADNQDTVIQPLKPVSNVFRYGSNEVPRFPVLPNFIITEVPTTIKPEDGFTPNAFSSESPTTQTISSNVVVPESNANDDSDNDDLNSVLDNGTDLKLSEDKAEEESETTTTTTTEPPTTTEIPTTTTTERSRRRPAIGGGRRRFNSPSFTSTRNRPTPTRGSTSSTLSTSTTTTVSPTRGSFRGSSRVRPRPSLGSNRPRTGSRTTEASEDKSSSQAAQDTTTVSTPSRSRFTSASPRRFQSSRSRSQTSSTTSTTRSPSSSSRSRPTSRPRPNLITRNRPPRPGFLRPRPGSEPEVPETTTTAPEPVVTEEETSPSGDNDELSSTEDDENETEEEEETSEETEEPTTTEGSRFSALFRPRNRNALGNRPRPVISNRPPRS